MTGMEDRWLSVEEIGKYLGISNDNIYRWIDKYAMPAHRMGRLWKFKKEDVVIPILLETAVITGVIPKVSSENGVSTTV